jgi:hypothetical protein
MLSEVGLQALAMLLQLTAGPVKLQTFEAFNTPITILLQVVTQGVFTNPHTVGYLMMR